MKTTFSANYGPATGTTSFRQFLQRELGRRCARNSQYSLRAFAKYLGLNHATLSQLLRGKRALTERTIERLGSRLGLDSAALAAFVRHESSRGSVDESSGLLRQVQQLTHDTAELITDWYHYAILELIHLPEFKPDSRWIARVLGITTDEVNLALTRLTRFGLLEMTDPDHWVDRSGDSVTSLEDFTHTAIERYAAQARDLWLRAADTDAGAPREHSSTTFAISTARLAEVLERIARFRRELLTLLHQDQARDDVYQLEIHLFPLTTLRKPKEHHDGMSGHAMADSDAGPG